MDDFGINPEGFNVKRLPDIKADLDERVALALNNQTSLLPDSPEGQLIGLFSILYADLWEQLNTAYSAFNPQSVIEQSLDNLVALNGLTRLTARPSTVTLTLTGTEGTLVPAGSIVSNVLTTSQFLTDVDVTVPAVGVVDVQAHSKDFGSIVADMNTLTVIETPVNGWVASDNIAPAVIGRLSETDAELRVRRSRSLSLSGQSSLDSIFTAVSAVSGVSYVQVTENVTDLHNIVVGEQPHAYAVKVFAPLVNPDTIKFEIERAIDAIPNVESRTVIKSAEPVPNLPPHSFSVVVQGGDDEQQIGDAIWNKKPVGILSYGDVDIEVKDNQGDSHIVSFQRPTNIEISVTANITFLTDTVPEDAEAIMAQAIVDYAEGRLVPGAGFGVGDDILHSRLYTPLNLSLQGHTVNELLIFKGSEIATPNDILIQFNEVGVFDVSRIVITVG